MILTIEEIRTMIFRVPALSENQLALVEMIRPMAESALKVWLDQEMEFKEHVELLPTGERIIEPDYLLDPRVSIADGRVEARESAIGNTLQLSNLPVWNTGIEVRVDRNAKAGQSASAFGAASLLPQGQDWWLDIDDATNELSRSGIIYHSSAWPSEPRTVRVTYFGGEKLDADNLRDFGRALKLAALKTFEHNYRGFEDRWENDGKGRITSEKLGEWSASYGGSGVSSSDIGTSGMSIPDSVKMDLWPFRRYSYM